MAPRVMTATSGQRKPRTMRGSRQRTPRCCVSNCCPVTWPCCTTRRPPGCAGRYATRRPRRVAMPHRCRRRKRVDRAGMVVPPPPRVGSGRVRVLAGAVRTRRPRGRASAHHSAIHRSVLAEEPRARPDRRRPDRAPSRPVRRRRRGPCRDVPTRRRDGRDGRASSLDRRRRSARSRSSARRAGVAMGSPEGHARRDDGVRRRRGRAGRRQSRADRTRASRASPTIPKARRCLQECIDAWHRLPPEARARIRLVSLPMDDLEENALMVNALQRTSTIVGAEEPRRGIRSHCRGGDVEGEAGRGLRRRRHRRPDRRGYGRAPG